MLTSRHPLGSRPRIGIPVRLSSSSDPDPRVGEAIGFFDYIVELVREGGGEPVLLAPAAATWTPRLYGEEQSAVCYGVNPAQDALDLAVARVADALLVTAVAEEGTIEALEDPERWEASVQRHPEALELSAEERLAPFRAFLDVCRSSQQG